jgi:hypothetical protein
MSPGRNMQTAPNGSQQCSILRLTFDAAPTYFGRFPEVSVPAPETQTNVILGLSFDSVVAGAMVMTYVTFSYASSVIAREEPPKQKKQASKTVSADSVD